MNFSNYQILEIDDSNLTYRLKYRFQLLKFCGADTHQRPIYRLVKQFRNYNKALEHMQELENTQKARELP